MKTNKTSTAPKISVITICYNAEKNIENAILSVIKQSYDNKEYIIVDGGSKDSTLSIINKYRNNIDIIVSEPDNGISDAFNKGIKKATGDVIGICNADDILLENALETISKEYEPGIDVFRFQEVIYNPLNNTRKLIKPTPIPKIPIQTHLLHMGCWVTPNAYERYGLYDTGFKYSMDYELIRRFSYMGAKMKYCNSPIGEFRLGGVSQTNRKGREHEKKIICERYGGGHLGAILWILYDRIKDYSKKILSFR